MDHSEAELLKGLANDLPHAYPHVIERFQQRLYAFAWRLTGNKYDAEDIVQEALVGGYVSLENYPPERIHNLQLQAWLYKITLNAYHHSVRSARLHIVPLSAVEGQEIDVPDCEEDRPEALFERREQHQELEANLIRLPERYRIPITCYYFEQLNYREIADLLDQPMGTVKSTIHRGLRHLRGLIDSSQAVRRGS